MKKEAILHMPLSQYAYAEDEHSLRIRIRVAKDDIKNCVLFYGDRVDQQKEIRVKELPMEKKASDDWFDYFETKIQDRYTRICYYFRLEDGTEKQFYCERGFSKELGCCRTEYFQFPYIRREDILSIPDWAADTVMYHIFPDSFASGRRALSGKGKRFEIPKAGEEGENLSDPVCSVSNLGGTLAGIRENLDYLQELGINCIYLNPVFWANSYHKYDTIDYFSVDPCFGTGEELKELVAECHKKGIRVLLDGVFNHCGPDFFAFRDVLAKGSSSEYYDWFYDMPVPVRYADPPSYEAFAYVKEMPKLNTGNPRAEEYLIRVGTYWIEEVGIDGWRLDVANEINHDFWRHFRSAIRKIKPDAFFIGEIWEDAGVWLQGDQFDSTMNYRFSYLCRDFFAERKLSVSQFDAQIQKMILRYPYPVALAQMNFLDSHDVPRFLSYCGGDRRRMELAFFYLFTSVGIPSVFYGDERYLAGVEEPEYRQAMPWDSEDTCYAQFRKWILARKEHPALSHGDYQTVYTDDSHGVYGFLRAAKEESLLVLLNNSDGEQKVSGLLEGKELCLKAMSGNIYVIAK
jgi:glycosidase